MYSSSSEVASLIGRRWKFLPLSKWSNRRLICRLPFLILWTLIVIVVLYKSLSDTNPKDSDGLNKIQESFLDPTEAREAKFLISPKQDQLHDVDDRASATTTKILNNDKPVMTNIPNNHGPAISTTKKSTEEEYSRKSKVFILIIQNEDHYPNQIFKKSPYYRGSGQTSPPLTNGDLHHSTRAFIPAHLRLLIEILNSHRIEYTVDTTRTGLPTSLLIDQDNSSETKQYSVIVIDDFIKYTKLNRWVRDQLDRHCRANQIGVVAYLMSVAGEELSQQHPTRMGRPPTTNTGFRQTRSGDMTTTTTEESLANQFPLSFKPIEQSRISCNNLSSINSCLIDYQLNERSPILRILKRRQNFILSGPLGANLDQLPWVSMSSNHITYEPLTWAKFRRGPQNQHDDEATIMDSPMMSRTQGIDHHAISNSLVSPGRMSRDDETLMSVSSGQQGEHKKMEAANSSMDANTMDNDVSVNDDDDIERQVLSMFDRGLYDGIKRVLFGGANHHWLNRIILLDAIEHLSSGRILGPLDRYIQVDIDDIFVGERGTRMNSSDVDALVEIQQNLAKRIDGGFKFNLGYSGNYFKHGFEQENLGDERLILRAKEFTWFCHTWRHSKAHLFNDVHGIITELRKNLEFARQHKLPLIGHDDSKQQLTAERGQPDLMLPPTYAIAPHHSGVYPIHEQLYDAWRQVLNVQVTSTEEYPRLRPANGRRAFVHKTIKVLPRQTCGLYTHTIYKHKYPGGLEKLEASIRGGELFDTILHNPVNIYMSHMSNYANDRLAPYTFSALIEFVQTNTNLQLRYAPSHGGQLGPAKLADLYFRLYPDERQPLWTNPCTDKRHLAIWAAPKHEYCSLVPKLLIVGPQKTGTTALYTFLKMNHLFRSSEMSPSDFEEIQFFDDKHYFKGVDWYLGKFSPPPADGEPNASADQNHRNGSPSSPYYYFDKSATYFDDPKAPKRASYLLPEARVVLLLVNPADRAYSWYQHIKAHGDPIANSMSFEQIIMGGLSSPLDGQKPTMMTSGGAGNNDEVPLSNNGSSLEAARLLRNRCLHPGYYAQHLTKWLDYYPSRQIIIIDGQWFRHNPASVMNRLQLLLRVERPLDYGRLLVYDQQKGFYCQRAGGRQSSAGVEGGGPVKRNGASSSSSSSTKCLGESKGRKYEPMSQAARLYLNRHYWPHNRQLARILSDIGQPSPIWLDEAMSSVGGGRMSPALMY